MCVVMSDSVEAAPITEAGVSATDWRLSVWRDFLRLFPRHG